MRRTILGLISALLIAAAMIAAPGSGVERAAAANERPLFQLPFECGEKWEAIARENHHPNSHSLDMYHVDGPEEGELILASAPGTIRKAEKQTSAGWTVSIWHANGWGTSYLHLLEEPMVVKGQEVEMGTPLGKVGSTGNSGAPHLHYQQWNNSHPDNTVESHFNGVPSGVRPGEPKVITSHNCGGNPPPTPVSPGVGGTSGVTFNGRFHSFFRRADSRVLEHRYTAGAGGGWSNHDVEGSVASAPVSVVHDGSMWVVARGTDNFVKYRFHNGLRWSAWLSAPGGLAGAPALGVLGDRMFVVSRSGSELVYLINDAAEGWDPQGWRSFEKPPSVSVVSDPAVGYFDGRLFVAVRGSDGKVWLRGYNGQWSGWTALSNSASGSVTGTPSVVSHGNTLFVFARSTDGSVIYHTLDKGATSWRLDRPLEGNIGGSPTAISVGGMLGVYARDGAGRLIYRSFRTSWSGWLSLGGPGPALDSSPVAMRYSTAMRVVAARATNQQLYIRTYADTSPWSNWTLLPGTHAPMS
jgi:Peptidase family M23